MAINTITSPSIDGDSATNSCSSGRCSDLSQECSGGFGCADSGDAADGSLKAQFIWPKDTPFPDDIDKIPKRCNIDTRNDGRQNDDQKQRPEPPKPGIPWRGELKTSPEKPQIAEPAI